MFGTDVFTPDGLRQGRSVLGGSIWDNLRAGATQTRYP